MSDRELMAMCRAIERGLRPEDKEELIAQARKDAAFEKALGGGNERKHKVGFAKPLGKAMTAGVGK